MPMKDGLETLLRLGRAGRGRGCPTRQLGAHGVVVRQLGLVRHLVVVLCEVLVRIAGRRTARLGQR